MYLLKKLSEYRKRNKYLDGYYYAAGELLRGTPVVYFREKMKMARDMSTHGLFDSGIEAAIYDWERKKCNCKSEEK